MAYKPSRRTVLVQLGAAAGAGLVAPLWINVVQRGGLPFAWGAGEGDVLPVGTPICVHVTMDGGNDYLNTLVPVDDPWYRDAAVGHGTLALTTAETIGLTGLAYRLHNELPWLANRWNTVGDVAFALGVGNGRANFSHFDSTKYWEMARLDVLGKTGWLGRYADAVRPQNPLASVSIADLRWEAIGATSSQLVVQECADFVYQTGHWSREAFAASAQQMATVTGRGVTTDVARMLGTTFQVTGRVNGSDDPAATGSSSGYGSLSEVAKNMVQAALLIKAGLPAQSYSIGHRGYDSHANQRPMQTARFRELNQALSKFFSVLDGHPRQQDVFVLITSEFGRQVTATKDLGTDHGQAGMAIFIGRGVQRGVFGQAPTLDPGGPTHPNRVGDAPRPTVDFRAIHATALNRLAMDDTNVADDVLGAHYEDLGLFAPYTPPPPTTTTTPPPPPPSTTVANKPPVATMSLSRTIATVGATVNADASGSRDPDGTIVSYRWDWGDGSEPSIAMTTSHKFTQRGAFTVRLTVTDDRGASKSASKNVVVY